MSTAKHTPGPWAASCRDIGYEGGDWPEDEFLQWEVHGPRVPWGRGEFFQADARLIAAAPELLDALEKVNEWACFASEEDVSARLMALQQIGVLARAAIAKATGEQA